MGHERVLAQELIAGRYRRGEAVHREEGRLVLRGEDMGTGHEVLLVRSRPAAHPRAGTPPRTADRIARETTVMARACPGRIARVIDVVEAQNGSGSERGAGEDGRDGALWTVLRPVDGVPLGELLARGPLRPVRAARIGLGLLEILRAAHRRGLTHGDLSPGQVFVREDDGVVLTGFGLIGSAPGPRVTAPSYAAPEQARGECAGPSADQWSLGALLYAMVEGRPPYRDRGETAATLRGVELLPLRPPAQAGPLAPAVTGLLRRSPSERVPEKVVHQNLERILGAEADEGEAGPAGTRSGGLGAEARRSGARGARRAGGGRSPRRRALLGAAFAVAASAVALYAARGGAGDEGAAVSRAAPTASRPSAVAPGGKAGRAASPAPSAPGATAGPSSPSPPATAGPAAPPARPPRATAESFARQSAPEGFSVDLPRGWRRVFEDRRTDGSYRVAFGASGDPRTLVVTHSLRLDPDPAADWTALEPGLRRSYAGYRRLGAIRAVTYRGLPGADMQWLATDGTTRTRTFGRGFLLDGRSGFSLRWTTPRTAYDEAGNRRALDRVLRTFRFPGG